MSKGMMTIKARTKLCRAHSGDASLPMIRQMAFGDGGINSQGNVFEATGTELALRNELLRKNIQSHAYPVSTTCRYSVRLEKEELAGENISELGLYDSDGELAAYKAFLPKGKDDDMEFIFDMDEIY